jgi:hypothetical protein
MHDRRAAELKTTINELLPFLELGFLPFIIQKNRAVVPTPGSLLAPLCLSIAPHTPTTNTNSLSRKTWSTRLLRPHHQLAMDRGWRSRQAQHVHNGLT